MSVQPFLIAAAGLFSIGIYGILVRRNVVMVLLSIELILNAVNINFVVFNAMLGDALLQGQIFTIFIKNAPFLNKTMILMVDRSAEIFELSFYK